MCVVAGARETSLEITRVKVKFIFWELETNEGYSLGQLRVGKGTSKDYSGNPGYVAFPYYFPFSIGKQMVVLQCK